MARKVGLAKAKAKEIMSHGGIDRIGGGFASAKQRRYIGWVAGGRKPRPSTRRR